MQKEKNKKMQKEKNKKKDVKHTVTREPLASFLLLSSASCPLPAHSLSLCLSVCCPSWVSVVCVALEAPGTSNKTNNSIFCTFSRINKLIHYFIISRWIVVYTTCHAQCTRLECIGGGSERNEWRYYRSNVFFSYSFKILKMYCNNYSQFKLYYIPIFLKYMY